MTKSTVVDSSTGGSVDSDVRTSTGSFYSRGQDEASAKTILSRARMSCDNTLDKHIKACATPAAACPVVLGRGASLQVSLF